MSHNLIARLNSARRKISGFSANVDRNFPFIRAFYLVSCRACHVEVGKPRLEKRLKSETGVQGGHKDRNPADTLIGARKRVACCARALVNKEHPWLPIGCNSCILIVQARYHLTLTWLRVTVEAVGRMADSPQNRIYLGIH